MNYVHLDDLRLSVIGLGCARLGSMGGASRREAETLLQHAHDSGITFFDTAASYGQGDSERYLGAFARTAPDICIVTKVGKVVPTKAMLVQPVKGLVRALLRRSRAASRTVRTTRGDRLETNFDTAFLSRQLDSSRSRLGMDRIPMVLLHSASAEVIRQGDAVEFLDRARTQGNIGIVGVSVDGLAAAETALGDARIGVIQVPMAQSDAGLSVWAKRAGASGKFVIAREVFRDANLHDPVGLPDRLAENLRRATEAEGVSTTLLGTTRIEHLQDLIGSYAKIAEAV